MTDKKSTYHYGLGRRKSAIAKVRLHPKGSGKITINDKTAAEYFDQNEGILHELSKPLALLGLETKYDISLHVSGGGMNGQVDAAKLAISNALSTMNDDLRGSLKKAGLLKRDPREKERKKYGFRRARKKQQFTKR